MKKKLLTEVDRIKEIMGLPSTILTEQVSFLSKLTKAGETFSKWAKSLNGEVKTSFDRNGRVTEYTYNQLPIPSNEYKELLDILKSRNSKNVQDYFNNLINTNPDDWRVQFLMDEISKDNEVLNAIYDEILDAAIPDDVQEEDFLKNIVIQMRENGFLQTAETPNAEKLEDFLTSEGFNFTDPTSPNYIRPSTKDLFLDKMVTQIDNLNARTFKPITRKPLLSTTDISDMMNAMTDDEITMMRNVINHRFKTIFRPYFLTKVGEGATTLTKIERAINKLDSLYRLNPQDPNIPVLSEFIYRNIKKMQSKGGEQLSTLKQNLNGIVNGTIKDVNGNIIKYDDDFKKNIQVILESTKGKTTEPLTMILDIYGQLYKPVNAPVYETLMAIKQSWINAKKSYYIGYSRAVRNSLRTINKKVHDHFTIDDNQIKKAIDKAAEEVERDPNLYPSWGEGLKNTTLWGSERGYPIFDNKFYSYYTSAQGQSWWNGMIQAYFESVFRALRLQLFITAARIVFAATANALSDKNNTKCKDGLAKLMNAKKADPTQEVPGVGLNEQGDIIFTGDTIEECKFTTWQLFLYNKDKEFDNLLPEGREKLLDMEGSEYIVYASKMIFGKNYGDLAGIFDGFGLGPQLAYQVYDLVSDNITTVYDDSPETVSKESFQKVVDEYEKKLKDEKKKIKDDENKLTPEDENNILDHFRGDSTETENTNVTTIDNTEQGFKNFLKTINKTYKSFKAQDPNYPTSGLPAYGTATDNTEYEFKDGNWL
jgi:hypothetical protein